jgi:hypothetical protein
MMSRWCDQSSHDGRNPHFPVALDEVVILFGTLVAETILASVHVRAPKQAGHMDASDLIKALQTPCKEGAVHIWRIYLFQDTIKLKNNCLNLGNFT